MTLANIVLTKNKQPQKVYAVVFYLFLSEKKMPYILIVVLRTYEFFSLLFYACGKNMKLSSLQRNKDADKYLKYGPELARALSGWKQNHE